MKIDVYVGVMGSGKDYEAQKLIDKGAVKIAFADALRDDMWKMLGWVPLTNMDYEDFKLATFTNEDLDISFTGRDLLQRYGTEVRRIEQDDIWVQRTMKTLLELEERGVEQVVITDARFKNELRTLLNLKEVSWWADIDFHMCNYKSEKYTLNSDHESEKFSIELTKLYEKGVFTDLYDYLFLYFYPKTQKQLEVNE